MILTDRQKYIITKRLMNVLKGQAMVIQDDNTITTREKNEQLKVVLGMAEFLKDYDNNMEILQKYKSKQYKER